MGRYQIIREIFLKEFLTILELSEYLNIKRSTLYSLVESRDIPHYRIARLIRFKMSEIEAWLKNHNQVAPDGNKRVKGPLKTRNKPVADVNHLVKKAIAEIKGSGYTVSHGKPDRIKGLRKEVESGTL
jgi:excisionase family DNA binding protein